MNERGRFDPYEDAIGPELSGVATAMTAVEVNRADLVARLKEYSEDREKDAITVTGFEPEFPLAQKRNGFLQELDDSWGRVYDLLALAEDDKEYLQGNSYVFNHRVNHQAWADTVAEAYFLNKVAEPEKLEEPEILEESKIPGRPSSNRMLAAALVGYSLLCGAAGYATGIAVKNTFHEPDQPCELIVNQAGDDVEVGFGDGCKGMYRVVTEDGTTDIER